MYICSKSILLLLLLILLSTVKLTGTVKFSSQYLAIATVATHLSQLDNRKSDTQIRVSYFRTRRRNFQNPVLLKYSRVFLNGF